MVGCPVGSIRRRNSLEVIIEDWCIGCGLCAENCPYGNINMHPFNVMADDPAAPGPKKRHGEAESHFVRSVHGSRRAELRLRLPARCGASRGSAEILCRAAESGVRAYDASVNRIALSRQHPKCALIAHTENGWSLRSSFWRSDGRLRSLCGAFARWPERRQPAGTRVWNCRLRVHDICRPARGAKKSSGLATRPRANLDARPSVARAAEPAADLVSRRIPIRRSAHQRLDGFADNRRRQRNFRRGAAALHAQRDDGAKFRRKPSSSRSITSARRLIAEADEMIAAHRAARRNRTIGKVRRRYRTDNGSPRKPLCRSAILRREMRPFLQARGARKTSRLPIANTARRVFRGLRMLLPAEAAGHGEKISRKYAKRSGSCAGRRGCITGCMAG